MAKTLKEQRAIWEWEMEELYVFEPDQYTTLVILKSPSKENRYNLHRYFQMSEGPCWEASIDKRDVKVNETWEWLTKYTKV